MTKNFSILVVDDDTSHRTMLATLLTGWGYTIFEANDGEPAIEMVKERYFDLILMDIRMLKVSGLEAMEVIKQINPAIPIIIMTAYSSIETAVGALKTGAYDYLTKPIDFDKLRLTIERATERLLLKEENQRLRLSLKDQFDRQNIIARSNVMTQLLDTVAQVATSEATVLITGESGTGKELIAGATHYNSARRDGPFVKINCAAITESLLESELFGHEKGAFTGAQRRKEGKFVQAHGGSIFLDEVSEMPLSMQVKLLRVLQEREITRVGGEDVLPIDVRVITATNKNLADLVREGKFREDLYYRLNVVDLYLPALRERRDDIPPIAQHYLQSLATKNRKEIIGFTPEAMDMLVRYRWPGNVRELINTVERGVVLCQSQHVGIDSLRLMEEEQMDPVQQTGGGFTGEVRPLEEVEKEAILFTLEATGNNKSETARQLGITRKTLHKKLKTYGVMP
ncbi:acetoacetate metabolism regulatory protein AtoC [Desulfoluna limicola]|uniref:Acetoacetate metabolism regulatory protein AtoC n=1 Tax=Desulfoluna limicola TaxID=2810562 RepID=A0ABM7PL77_9BACT|nr:sigma-54 dependent transcriptional regulator [Desulfoluna limicola]BCS97938.1 acetoacetate metabolism regulatory protein AtoC [Desulfoluna limicola]